MMIIAAIGIFAIAFLIGMGVGRDSNAYFLCRHDWEEAVNEKTKHGTCIGYVCKKCKGTRTACFNFDEE